MTTKEFIELRERLEAFANKSGKEISENEDLQKLVEGCIWIGAVWMENALGIKGIQNKED
jgi:hypothetical protein